MFDRARFRTSGDRALLVQYGDGIDPAINQKVRRMADLIRRSAIAGIGSVVPSYAALSIVYDPLLISSEALQESVHALESGLERVPVQQARTVTIPVCYGGAFGPDLGVVAHHNHISEEEVVRRHSAEPYHIYAMGFMPGFCYLGGLDEKLRTPRLETPRTFVPAGSVGIAENQTGIYPLDSPGGWQLIGRTPLRLFAPDRPDPFLYQAGDRIRFCPVSMTEFERLRREEAL